MNLTWKSGLLLVVAAIIGLLTFQRQSGQWPFVPATTPADEAHRFVNEGERRDEMLRLITRDYVKLGANVSPGMASGNDLAPAEYINQELIRLGAKWRVRKKDGEPIEWFDIS